MQILGICRFSYPAMGGFQIEHGSIEARSSHHYATVGLHLRLRCCETLILRSIREQSDTTAA
ncbi:MAG: glycosyltransferase, partial [Paracoccaceae bacterium]